MARARPTISGVDRTARTASVFGIELTSRILATTESHFVTIPPSEDTNLRVVRGRYVARSSTSSATSCTAAADVRTSAASTAVAYSTGRLVSTRPAVVELRADRAAVRRPLASSSKPSSTGRILFAATSASARLSSDEVSVVRPGYSSIRRRTNQSRKETVVGSQEPKLNTTGTGSSGCLRSMKSRTKRRVKIVLPEPAPPRKTIRLEGTREYVSEQRSLDCPPSPISLARSIHPERYSANGRTDPLVR